MNYQGLPYNGFALAAPVIAAYPPPPSHHNQAAFNIQMMQLHVKILEERRKNLKLKHMIAQNIIQGQQSQTSNLRQEGNAKVYIQQHSNQNIQNMNNYHPVKPIQSPYSDIDSEAANHHPHSSGAFSSVSDVSGPSEHLANIVERFKENRHSVADENHLHMTRRAIAQPNHKLKNLREQVSKAAQDNSKLLATDTDDQLPTSKRKIKEQKEARAKHRQDVVSLLQNKPNNKIEILPRWKHLLLYNNPNPHPYTVMKSLRLFRVIAWSIAHLITGPIVKIHKRKSNYVERDRKEFKRTLDLFMETLDEWMGKIVQTPIQSVVSDASLDFDFKDQFVAKSRIVQLKVRLRGLVTAISQAPMPSPSITAFLGSLISDGTYLPEDFLWAVEHRQLDFDRLGALRAMITEVDPLFASRARYKVFLSNPSSNSGEEINANPSPTTLNITCARFLLINFLLVRILIYRIGLTPWQHGVTGQPANRNIRKTVLNLRVLNTLFYQLLRLVNDKLPPLSGYNKNKRHNKLLARSSKPEKNKTEYKRGLLSAKQPVHDNNQDDNTEVDESTEVEVPSEPTGILKSVLKLAGLADTTPGFEVFKKDSIEFQLLQPKLHSYCSLEHLQSLLLSQTAMSNVDMHSSQWLDELVEPLASWIQKLCEHVVINVYMSRQKKSGGDNAIS